MPMIAFFPWAVLDEPLVAGDFTIAPFGEAARLLPRDHAEAGRNVIAAYDKSNDDDAIARVPVLFLTTASPTDDVPEEKVGTLFQVGDLIAFAALASRQFFMPTYWNRDSFHLVVQGFRPERPGGAVITSRRRDGSADNYVSAKHYRVPRPHHVPQGPMDRLDHQLLDALIAASDAAQFSQLLDAVRGFNAANTDSPSISQQTELVTLIGAYGRLLNEWDEKGTVAALAAVLAKAPNWPGTKVGPKPELPRLRDKLAKSKSMKREWIADAYVLRGQFAHGHADSRYAAVWGLRDHLLLGSYLFPLTVKAWLASVGRYTLSPKELMHIAAFDALASYDHFEVSGGEDGENRRPSNYPWVQVIQSIPLQQFLADLSAQSAG